MSEVPLYSTVRTPNPTCFRLAVFKVVEGELDAVFPFGEVT